MSTQSSISRRSFLAASVALPLLGSLRGSAASKPIPIGLELYSVRNDLKKDLSGTLDDVAKLGYQCVEFYAPYYEWTPAHAKQVRSQLDSLGLRCYSTHNSLTSFTPKGIGKAIELNQIIGTEYIVLAHPGENVDSIEGWKKIADTLDQANKTMAKDGLHAGYHNHDLEWRPIDGQTPLEVIASNTDKSVMLQLDVGTCLATGNNPVTWIKSNPNRIRSLHLKDWSPQQGYRVVFGKGIADWKNIFEAAESTGGVEYYLIEQEGSKYPEMETAKICLQNYKKIMV